MFDKCTIYHFKIAYDWLHFLLPNSIVLLKKFKRFTHRNLLHFFAYSLKKLMQYYWLSYWLASMVCFYIQNFVKCIDKEDYENASGATCGYISINHACFFIIGYKMLWLKLVICNSHFKFFGKSVSTFLFLFRKMKNVSNHLMLHKMFLDKCKEQHNVKGE